MLKEFKVVLVVGDENMPDDVVDDLAVSIRYTIHAFDKRRALRMAQHAYNSKDRKDMGLIFHSTVSRGRTLRERIVT